MNNSSKEQEQHVSDAFSKQSEVFDSITKSNALEVLYREIIRDHVLDYAKQGQHLLELNCGTGLDAVFFANHGLNIHATDNSDGMLDQLKQKITESAIQTITYEKCSFNNLKLVHEHPQGFDHVFSNYGGLNCSENISSVINQVTPYLKRGGMVHFVMIAPICLWELATVFKGKYKFAFRRLTKQGIKSHLEGHYFTTYYYSPKQMLAAFGDDYELIKLKSLGCFLPPTYNDYFPNQYPKLFSALKKMELATHTHWPFNRVGDLFVISMRKR